MERVAIIGLGISGSGVLRAYQKIKSQEPSLEIDIHAYDINERIGKGIPFSEDYLGALINSRSYEISIDYENMEEYYHWLQNNPDYQPYDYTARSWYGDYNLEKTNELIQALQVTVHHHMVKTVDYQKGQWVIEDDNGQVNLFDRVHLCCGELPVIDHYQLLGQKQYIHNPYPLTQIKDKFTAQDHVAVIGTGLTSIDMIKYLIHETNVEKIFVFSKSGYFPTVRGDDQVPEFHYLTEEKMGQLIEQRSGYLYFEDFQELLLNEMKHYCFDLDEIIVQYFATGVRGLRLTIANAERVGKLQAIALQVTNLLTTGWRAMRQTDREQYAAKYHKLIVKLRNPVPPSSAEEIIEAVNQERVIIFDEVSDIEAIDNDGFALVLENPDHQKVDWVINTTGMVLKNKADLTKDSLLYHLVNHEYVQIDDFGGLSINIETGNIISPKFGEIDTLHAHGMLIEGVVYQNNSTIKIQEFSERLLQSIYFN